MADISWELENIGRGAYVLVMSFYVYSFVPSYPVSAAYHSVPDYLACEVGEVALWLGGRSGVGEEAKRQASEVTCETVKRLEAIKTNIKEFRESIGRGRSQLPPTSNFGRHGGERKYMFLLAPPHMIYLFVFFSLIVFCCASSYFHMFLMICVEASMFRKSKMMVFLCFFHEIHKTYCIFIVFRRF